MKKKILDYPTSLTFKEGDSNGFDPKTSFTISKGIMVGGIELKMRLNDRYKNYVDLDLDIDEHEFLKLQAWLNEWRKAYEHNNGPIEKPPSYIKIYRRRKK